MIELEALSRSFTSGEERHEILKQVQLKLEFGGYLAIQGRSGCGKSTLLKIVGALDPDFEGEVKIAGSSLRGLSDDQRSALRGEQIGFVFQSFNLVPEFSALENVLLGLLFAGDASGAGESERNLREKALRALAAVGLEGAAGRRPDALSGGEKQRVAIARALVKEPKLLLCDEPTGNLDPKTGASILELFDGLNASGLTLMVVTHDARVSERASFVQRLEAGALHPSHAGEGVR